MAKVKRRNPATPARARTPLDMSRLLARVSERIALPQVPMRFDYQDDVDTLCIRFEGTVSSSLVSGDDEVKNGVVGIYEGRKLVGLEILDISGRLRDVNPT